ncbi:hypothetical protein N7454_011003 [Penicillium verhagenii]|nr:hypothetical protein N7454_011003 [Penicillium verhagenii]
MASMNKPPTHTVTQGPLVREHQSDITTAAFLQALNATRTCILDTHGAWSSQRGVDTELFEALSSYVVGRDFNSAIYWLFVRLGTYIFTSPFTKKGSESSLVPDLGAALATDTNLQIPLPPLPPNVADADTKTDTFASSFCYANRPLWACARAIEFMHNEDASPQCPPLHTWMQLVEELENWYQERPQGFQPMLELDVENNLEMAQGFPVVLFANGAGVFSNQLYHTAMLLLLHSRPRTARIASLRSATMSPLWHAQRICSIALNNERRECWDPCLLASFITAAQRMTHETQQQEILLGLSRIRKVTGWNVDGLLHGLKESWGFLES